MMIHAPKGYAHHILRRASINSVLATVRPDMKRVIKHTIHPRDGFFMISIRFEAPGGSKIRGEFTAEMEP